MLIDFGEGLPVLCVDANFYTQKIGFKSIKFFASVVTKKSNWGLFILHVGKSLVSRNLRNWLTRWAFEKDRERCEWQGSQFPSHYQKESLLLLLVGPDWLLFSSVVVVVLLSTKLNLRQNIWPTSSGGTWFTKNLCRFRCWFGQYWCWNVVPSLSKCAVGPLQPPAGAPSGRPTPVCVRNAPRAAVHSPPPPSGQKILALRSLQFFWRQFLQHVLTSCHWAYSCRP